MLAALAVFGVVTAVGAAGFEWRARSAAAARLGAVLLALNALALAGARRARPGRRTRRSWWLAALAVAHLAAGLLGAAATARARQPRAERSSWPASASCSPTSRSPSVADGLPLVLGWAAGAVAFSALARAARRRADEAVALTGLGGHLLLAVATALTGAAPLAAASGGAPDAATAAAALAALAAGAWAAARLVAPRRPERADRARRRRARRARRCCRPSRSTASR